MKRILLLLIVALVTFANSANTGFSATACVMLCRIRDFCYIRLPDYTDIVCESNKDYNGISLNSGRINQLTGNFPAGRRTLPEN